MPKFYVEKSILVETPVAKAFAVVRDFYSWSKWSPWIIAEPNCKVKVAPDGMQNSWDGEIIGSGNMLIEKAESNKAIHYRLTFLKPWKSVSEVSFLFEPHGEGVKLTWTMEGSIPFFMFFMTKMMTVAIGMDYERGLKMLKDYIESGSVPSKLSFPGVGNFQGFQYVGLKTRCRIEELSENMRSDFTKLRENIGDAMGSFTNCFSIYHKWDLVKGFCEYTAGCHVEQLPEGLSADFIAGEFPACSTYKVIHQGSYRHIGNAWAAGMMHARAKVFTQSKVIHPFETYANDPAETPENELITNIHFPIK
jgi:hypothetical protein